MELRSKIYRMFMLGPESDGLVSEGNLEKALKSGLGGVIFFTKNIKSIKQTKEFVAKIKKAAKFPVFLGIDQEGGRVERTENIFNGKKWLSARYQAEKGLECVEQQTREIAEFIKSLGFNMNFAPVLDVDTNPENPIIAERAYGKTAEEVIKYAIVAAKIYQENGIIPVGKHFPGHGDVNVDSHLALPMLECSAEEVENVHLKPFKAAADNGIPAIMVAHLACPCFDAETVPASLSENVIKKVLRDKIGFQGLVVSDDMNMGGVGSYEPIDAVVRGIKAGINLFLFRGSDDKTISIIEQVCELSRSDEELRRNIESSNSKIEELIHF